MKAIVLSYLFLFLTQVCSAQTVGLSLDKVKTAKIAVGIPPQYPSVFLLKNGLHTYQNVAISVKKPTQIPSVFSVEALPFFCKIEYKMGLNKKLPVKFRLGDVQYVDELERK
ncbi:MAG: hypothetical protein U5L45_05630 [Saprospiraceae bacterium]|nr:hypothetical protein [Saprospiraceae bacterium]